MTWEIGANLGRESRSNYDGHGWLWEIRRGAEWPQGDVRRVLVEISGTAWTVEREALPADTLEAMRTEGESEVAKVLDLDDPPRVIQCGTGGCRAAPDASQTDI